MLKENPLDAEMRASGFLRYSLSSLFFFLCRDPFI
jgi:hypothetical protein